MAKKHVEPSPAQISAAAVERQEENRKNLRISRALAAKIFETTTPTIEMVVGVGEALADLGDDEGLAAAHLTAAKKIAEGISIASPADVFALADILLEDEEAEAHLADAVAETRGLQMAGGAALDDGPIPYSVALDDVITVYYEIYYVETETEE